MEVRPDHGADDASEFVNQPGFWPGMALLLSPILIWMALALFTAFGGSQELAGGLSWFAIVAIFTATPAGIVVLIVTGVSYMKKARAKEAARADDKSA